MKGFLIINADDFGASRHHTDIILESFRLGLISSSTFLVNLPYAAEAADRLRTEFPGLSHKLGLHLNLISEKPLSEAMQNSPFVDENGNFKDFRSHLSLFRQIRHVGKIRAEVDAQIRTFREFTGHYPVHIDSHGHSHVSLAVILAIFLSREARNVKAIRRARSYPFLPAINFKDRVKRMIVPLFNAVLRMKFRTVRVFIDIRYRDGSFIDSAYLKKVIEKYGAVEMMCHPALGLDIEEFEFLKENRILDAEGAHKLGAYQEYLG